MTCEKSRVTPKVEVAHANVIEQITELVQEPDFITNCQHWQKRKIDDDILADLYEGRVWQEWKEWFLESPLNLAWMLNIDWL